MVMTRIVVSILRKEIEACVRNGRLSHLAKGARAQNNNQSLGSSGAADKRIPKTEWTRKEDDSKLTNEILMTRTEWNPPC